MKCLYAQHAALLFHRTQRITFRHRFKRRTLVAEVALEALMGIALGLHDGLWFASLWSNPCDSWHASGCCKMADLPYKATEAAYSYIS